MNRSLKVFLTLSLLLNLLLAGVLIGSIGRNWMEGPMHHIMPPPEVMNNWPADKREAFEHAMNQVGKDTEPLRDELHEAHKKASDIVKADTFDKAAYLKQTQRIHELHGKLANHMAQAIAELASQWSPQDRALLADVVRGPMMPPPAPPGHGHGDVLPPPPPGDEPPPPMH